MLILDDIDSKFHNKFTHDFKKLLKNYSNINVCFGIKQNDLQLAEYKNILFKIDDYDNNEKKIIKTIICYFLMSENWEYIEIRKYTKDTADTKDKKYYIIMNGDHKKDYCYYGCNKCEIPLGMGIIYDKNNINYYSSDHGNIKQCICHSSKLYNLNSLFNQKYKEFKLLCIINDEVPNTINNNKINNNNDINNNGITTNISGIKIDIKIQIEINNEHIFIRFINITFAEAYYKLIQLFGHGEIIYDNETYKYKVISNS